MIILGIESSCDDTAVALVEVGRSATESRILAQRIYTQKTEHAAYGGVVPELAARAHLLHLPKLFEDTLGEARLTLNAIDGVAATRGPGLLGGLLVGTAFAKSLALAHQKPYLGVNHLEGHALTAHLTEKIDFPYLLLLVSGGHCQFIQVERFGEYTLIGATLDDAVGECFDKVARMVGLGNGGGAAIERCARQGNAAAYSFPKPLPQQKTDFSFSGLKTAVRNCIQAQDTLSPQQQADICASFQATVADVLIDKTHNALALTEAKTFVLAGGVAANTLLRSGLEEVCATHHVAFYAPPLALCTDNAAMIAYAGGLRLRQKQCSPLDESPLPRWPLSELTLP